MAKPAAPSIDARASALRLLGRREHSRRQLEHKLVSRGVGPIEARRVCEQMEQSDFLSDRRFAEMLVRSRISQCYGPLRIHAELKLAGIAGDDIEYALREQEADWQALADHALSRKFHAQSQTAAERAKRARYLLGRGFDMDTTKQAVNARHKGAPP